MLETNNKEVSSEAKEPEIDLSSYEDPSGLSFKKINFGFWLISRRHYWLRLSVLILVCVAMGLLIYASYNYLYYFLHEKQRDAQLANSTSTLNTKLLAEDNTPKDLDISDVSVFTNKDRYDFAVKIKNPNPKHIAYLSYCFSAAEQDISCGQAFVYPSDEKYVLALAQSTSGAGLKFNIKNLAWQKINTRLFPDWADFLKTRLRFVVTGISFRNGGAAVEKGNFNSLEFVIENQSAYSYWEVPINILIESPSGLVGVNRLVLSDFKSLEKKNVRLSWLESLPSASVRVVPDIDVSNESIYRKPQN